MRYFFQSGIFIDLSQAELISVFQSFGISRDSIKSVGDGIFLVESNTLKEDILGKVFSRLGGFIRYGQVIDDLDSFLPLYSESKKVTFGVSYLNSKDIDIKSIQKLSNEIKRYFKSLSIYSRFIIPKKAELNEAQIRNNKILEDGFEFCIFNSSTGLMYGKTLAVQDVEGFVKRDLEKPFSNYDMGVLPQKLARIMCNLTGLKDGIIWDPFCGSGTVLMEAAMLGFDILGTDIDHKALTDTNENIQWLRDEGMISDTKYNLFPLDIKNVEKKIVKDIKRTGISAVVCEPFMGPPQRRLLTVHKAELLLEDIRKLYNSLFTVLNDISKSGFKAVLILPSYKTLKGTKTLNISEFTGKKWEVLNKKYTKGDLKWERNNSIITRNIFILTKK